MNLIQMQTAVLRMLDNLQSTDPFYTDYLFPTAGNEATSVLNQSANRLLRMAVGNNGSNMNAFPELHDTFNLGPTVAGTNTLTRPTNCIAIQRISSSRQATLPTWDTTREYPTTYLPPTTFGQLGKTAATASPNYVSIYTLIAKTVVVFPTPAAGFIDYLRLYGLRAETPLVTSATTTTFIMDVDWHPLVVKLAASTLAGMRNNIEKEKQWFGEVVTELQLQLGVNDVQVTGGGVVTSDIMPERYQIM